MNSLNACRAEEKNIVRIAPNTEIFEQDQVKRNLFDIQMALAMQ